MSSDDPLAAALSKAKGFSRRPSSVAQSHSNGSTKRKSAQDLSTCSFCESEAAAICISKSLTKATIPLCLVHYYTTRSCRIDPQKVSVLNKEELKTQLPYVQDLFSEAFAELQKEIGTESARSFIEMSKREADPLSILNDSHRRDKVKIPRGPPKNAKEGRTSDGGFMTQVQRREIDLVDQQRKRVAISSTTATGGPRHHNGTNSQKQTQFNPYKRRKISTKSSWHLVLEGKTNPEPSESLKPSQAFPNKCSCGGGAILFGNTTSSNNDVSKAEIWGASREHDISTRYQCQKCGKIWNEHE